MIFDYCCVPKGFLWFQSRISLLCMTKRGVSKDDICIYAED